MSSDPTPADPSIELTAPNEAPPWDRVPFDVGCSRCGHDLRGLSEPRCPACELDFDWADAVPIERLRCEYCAYQLYGLTETRCPECGEAFTWEKALERYRRSQKPLFEYHWRERPVRSFIKACSLAARPWKLWRLIEIHDPPLRSGLLMLLVLTVLVLAVSLPVIGVTADFAVGQLERGTSATRWPFRPYTRPWQGRPWMWYGTWLGLTAAWSAGSLGALLMLRQSMSLCKVRNAHVFRVYVYAMLPAMFGQIGYCLLVSALDCAMAFWPVFGRNTIVPMLLVVYPLVAWFWVAMSMALAFRLCIKMRHAWWVAISSQAIALMLAMCVGFVPLWIRWLFF